MGFNSGFEGLIQSTQDKTGAGLSCIPDYQTGSLLVLLFLYIKDIGRSRFMSGLCS